jgi:hypothetical protein
VDVGREVVEMASCDAQHVHTQDGMKWRRELRATRAMLSRPG